MSINFTHIMAPYSESRFGVETRIVQADFSEGESIYEELKSQFADLDIGILG